MSDDTRLIGLTMIFTCPAETFEVRRMEVLYTEADMTVMREAPDLEILKVFSFEAGDGYRGDQVKAAAAVIEAAREHQHDPTTFVPHTEGGSRVRRLCHLLGSGQLGLCTAWGRGMSGRTTIPTEEEKRLAAEERIREIVREELQYSRQRYCRECNSYFSMGHRQNCPDFDWARLTALVSHPTTDAEGEQK